jgi:hypothetical protein
MLLVAVNVCYNYEYEYMQPGGKMQNQFTNTFYLFIRYTLTASVVRWSRVPTYRSRDPVSIPGSTRFSDKQWVWNGVHSAS